MKKFFYLIETEFLGYRYHGWQKQNQVLTVQQALERVLKYLLPANDFKTIPASRTDKLVSAKQHFFQLFCSSPVEIDLLQLLNQYLPLDIKIISVKEIDKNFQIISSPREKEYHYYFYSHPDRYPMAAPFLHQEQQELNIPLMQEGAKVFEGEHDFFLYHYRPKENSKTIRHISVSEIKKNDLISANFFPPTSYYLKVISDGFGRHQIRLMMGVLLSLGRMEIELEQIKESLDGKGQQLAPIAPAAGLTLYRTIFL